jgi:hypothetical protein
VTWSDDDQSMSARSDEELLRGLAADADPALTALVAMLRASADDPAPRPTDALATLLRTGRAPDPVAAAIPTTVPVPLGTRLRRLTSRVAALGLAAKIALTAGVAVASVGAAATLHVGPDVVQRGAAATLGHLVQVFTPGSHAAPDPGHHVPAEPAAGTGDDGAVPGVPSHHPTSTESPTSLPKSAEDGRTLTGPVGSGHTEPTDPAVAADHGLPLSGSQAVRPSDPATDPSKGVLGSGSGLPGLSEHAPTSTSTVTPSPTPNPMPSADPSHAAHGD